MAKDDRILELFYEAIESFPAEYRDAAERWLFECEVAHIFFRAVDAAGLSALRRFPARMN
jgi:hypothetical protein